MSVGKKMFYSNNTPPQKKNTYTHVLRESGSSLQCNCGASQGWIKNQFHSGIYLWPPQGLAHEVCINETAKELPQLVKRSRIQWARQTRLQGLLGNRFWTGISTCPTMSDTKPEVRGSQWWAPICCQDHPRQRNSGCCTQCISLPWKVGWGWKGGDEREKRHVFPLEHFPS